MFDYLFEIALAIGVFVLGLLDRARRVELGEVKKAASDAEDEADATRKALDAHRLYAAETFARREEMRDSVEAVESRLKEALGQTEKRLAEAQADIAKRLDDIRDRLPSRSS